MDQINPQNYCRTEEEIYAILHHAKVDFPVVPITQVLYFSNSFNSTKLLELPDELFNVLSEGQTLHFRGLSSDKAVLCSEDKTFEVKEVETSNSLLLVQDLKFPNDLKVKTDIHLLIKHIVNVHYSYMEVKQIPPKIRPLLMLIEKNYYQFPDLEPTVYNLSDGYYTSESLLEEIQISSLELKAALKTIDAFNLNGFWRILGPNCVSFALNDIISMLDENFSIAIGEIVLSLKQIFPPCVIEQVITLYMLPTGEVNHDGEELYELNKNKYCKFVAESILIDNSKFNLVNFLNFWSQSVLDGMTVDLKMIEDIAVVEKHSVTTVCICYFPERKLSEDVEERFRELFSMKKNWTYSEIYPFLARLTSEKVSAKALLTKYTRSFRENDEVYFGPKYGK